MAQIIVRNLDDSVRDMLRDRARAHGRSMEEEVRDILRAAVVESPSLKGKGLGSRIAELFRGQADLGDGPFVVEETGGGVPEPMSFDE